MNCRTCNQRQASVSTARTAVGHAARALLRRDDAYRRAQLAKAQQELQAAKNGLDWHLREEH